MADFFGGKLVPPTENDPHFNQPKQRSAEFLKPDNVLKKKVGDGGLDETILQKAQELLDKNDIDFTAQGQRYLTALKEGIRLAETQRSRFDTNTLLATIIQPGMQMKANGTMFGYPLVTKIADLMIRFTEVINELDNDALEIFSGFRTALNAVILGQIRGDGGQEGQDLYNALNDACQRYFDKNKN